MSAPQTLRDLLARPEIIRSFGAHDVFSALIMERAGVPMLFLGGFGVSASLLGLPDVGLTTLTEMTDAVRRTTQRVKNPIVADGDTGHGGLQNVARTVSEFERAGAAGILIEDQVFPKRCGHLSGKQVVPVEVMLDRLQAALDARQDENFVVFARTDARAVEGIEAAIDRANRYADAGADVCFVEAPQSRDELQRIARDVECPLLANMLLGGVTPILSAEELEDLGYKIVVCPIASLLTTGFAIQKIAHALLSQGRLDQLSSEMLSFAEITAALDLEEFTGAEPAASRPGADSPPADDPSG